MSETSIKATSVELVDKLLSLAVAYPRACTVAAKRLIASTPGLLKFAIACDAIGFEYSRQLFENIPESSWLAMENLLEKNVMEVHGERASQNVGKSLMDVYTFLLADCMSWDSPADSQDPFEFLHGLTDQDLSRLLSQEETSNVALIGSRWSPKEMARILVSLPSQAKRQVILQVARLQRLPEQAIEQAAQAFAKKLRLRAHAAGMRKSPGELARRDLGVIRDTVPASRPAAATPPPFPKSHLKLPEIVLDGKVAEEVVSKLEASVTAAAERQSAQIEKELERSILEFLRAEAPEVARRISEGSVERKKQTPPEFRPTGKKSGVSPVT